VTSGKSYSTEARLNSLINALGPYQPAAGGGGNGQRVTQLTSLTGQTIISTTPVNITGLSVPVTAGAYRVKAEIVLDVGAGGGAADFRFTGPAASTILMTLTCQQLNTSTVVITSVESNSAGYNSGFLATQVLGATFYLVQIWATFVFTAAGTLALQGAEGTSLDTWEIYPGSLWTVESVGQTS